MQISKWIKRKTISIVQWLCCPNDWINIFRRYKTRFFIVGILFMIMGIAFNSKYNFFHFYIFFILFYLIGIIAFLCINYYSKQMTKIVNALAIHPSARSANCFYYTICKKTSLYIWIPMAVTLIFEIGGCNMLATQKINPVLLWILCLFTVVVYISIVGYLQYIFLFLYIFKLANSKEDYGNILHNLEEYIPAELEWLQDLTKLCHIYRSAFFTLGTLYILAFALFCFLPKMNTNIHSTYFIVLWSIIFIAIVVVFPITAVIERLKIKSIVLKLKKTYVKNLRTEIKIKNKNESLLEKSQRRFFETMYIAQIMNSKDYPINSIGNSIYDVFLSVFNIAASVITIIQSVSIILIDFHHMF